MKLIKSLSIGLVAISILSYSCGGGENNTSSEELVTSTPPVTAPAQTLEEKYKDDPIFVTGSTKARDAGCTACHMVERKIVGPAYADVAEKYESNDENVAMLVDHVINGHVGTWGEVPMPAQPHLDKADVEDMVKYVLLLKK